MPATLHSYPHHSHLAASAAHAKRATSNAGGRRTSQDARLVTRKIFRLSARGVEINKHPGQKCVVIKANLIALSQHTDTDTSLHSLVPLPTWAAPITML